MAAPPTVSLAALQRACVNVSAPLRKGDTLTLSVVLKMIQNLADAEATQALAKALVWRLSEGSVTGTDRLGAWTLLEGVVDEIHLSQTTGESASILVDTVCRSLPDLIRSSWEYHHLQPGDASLAIHYAALEKKWCGRMFTYRMQKKIALAFSEAKKSLQKVSRFQHLVVPSDAVRDSLWKLRREDSRPLMARRLFKLFDGKTTLPTCESEIKSLPHVLHSRLGLWFEKLIHNPGCSLCDTFHHDEVHCPCRQAGQQMRFEQAINVLTPLVSNPADPAVLEVFDAVVRLMTASRPFQVILGAFDTIRGSKTTSKEQSALYMLSTYALTPSKLKSNGKYLALPDALKHHLEKSGRLDELENLSECLLILRSGFFAYEESEHPNEDFEKWVRDLTAERLMLFAYFDKKRNVDLPAIDGWDRRLRRIGVHCARLCRKCLSTTHCTQECAAQADYDYRAATDALRHHRFMEEKLDDGVRTRIVQRMDELRPHRPLEAHKLEMALLLLFPGGDGSRPAQFCATCRVFGHSAARCRTALMEALSARTEWPLREMSVCLFGSALPKYVTTTGVQTDDDRAKAILSYSRANGFPPRYAEALLALTADNTVFPTPKSAVGEFSPAMVRYHPDLVESLLRESGRQRFIPLLEVFRERTFPEPCLYCGTVGHQTIRCAECTEEAKRFLRNLYWHDLSLLDVVRASSAGSRSPIAKFLESMGKTVGYEQLQQRVAQLQRQCVEANRSYVQLNGYSEGEMDGYRLKGSSLTKITLTQTLPASISSAAAHGATPEHDPSSTEEAGHASSLDAEDEKLVILLKNYHKAVQAGGASAENAEDMLLSIDQQLEYRIPSLSYADEILSVLRRIGQSNELPLTLSVLQSKLTERLESAYLPSAAAEELEVEHDESAPPAKLARTEIEA